MDKCDAEVGGNRCGFEAEYCVQEPAEILDPRTFYACDKHVGIVMQENDIDRAEVEKL